MLGLLVNWVAAALLAFTIFFYVVDLYGLAQALDPAEHRHRRRGRRVPADDRLGGCDGLAVARARAAVPHHLLLDAAAFLGAGALPRATTMPAPASRCCPWSPATSARDGRFCSIRLILVPLGVAPWLFGLHRRALRRDRGRRRCDHDACWACRCCVSGRPVERASRKLFAFSILYLFLLFAVLLVERGWGGLIARLAA